MFQSLAPAEAKASILLFNSGEKKLYVGAAPSLPEVVVRAFEGFMTGDRNASCGTAAYRGEQVIVEDVSASPLWKDFKEFALENKILACWSIPFFSDKHKVLGTFAISLPRPTAPTKYDIERLETAGYLASIVIERVRSENALRSSEEKFSKAFRSSPISMALSELKSGRFLEVNDGFEQLTGYSRAQSIGRTSLELNIYVNPDDRKALVQKLEKDAVVHDFDISIYTRGGEIRHVQYSAEIIKVGEEQLMISSHYDMTERKQAEHLQNAQEKILKQIISGVSQKEILTDLCLMFESLAPKGVRATISLLNIDEQKLYVSAAPSMPEKITSALNGLSIGEANTSCGTAAYKAKTVIVEDIKQSPLWVDYCDIAFENGVQAVWSKPFFSEKSEVLGTFAIALPRPTNPTKHDIERLNMAGYLASIVVERTRSEIELKNSEARFRSAFGNAPMGTVLIDQAGIILQANSRFIDIIGFTQEEMVGKELSEFIHPDDKDSCLEKFKALMSCEIESYQLEKRYIHKHGRYIWCRLSVSSVCDQNNKPLYVIAHIEDISEARILSDKLVYQATHDSLTGLMNRHEFETRLHRAINSVQTENTEHVLCYLDLDQFKIINDTCGHMAGDGLLRQLSEMMRGYIRTRDSLARLGGDEFGVLIEHCSLKKAEQIADNLRQAVADFQFHWDDKMFKIGVSIGMVSINNDSISVENVLMVADNACYTAKGKGRNRIHVHIEGDIGLENRRREMLWTSRIQKAFDEDRFCLVAQTIVPLNSKESKGKHFEILVRMIDENGKIILPNVFIPVAERYHLITRLDRHVVNMTIDWLNNNPDIIEQLELCSINLSGPSLVDDTVLEFIIKKLSESKVPAEKICFEITETAAISNLTSANYFITRLKQEGCKFALDDFGSGLSSFTYLKSLPVDFLKIDGVFIRDIENEQTDFAIVKSIYDISRALNKKTIAEFVENESILKILEEIGIDYAQGYGISRPQPLDELIDIETSGSLRKCQINSQLH